MSRREREKLEAGPGWSCKEFRFYRVSKVTDRLVWV